MVRQHQLSIGQAGLALHCHLVDEASNFGALHPVHSRGNAALSFPFVRHLSAPARRSGGDGVVIAKGGTRAPRNEGFQFPRVAPLERGICSRRREARGTWASEVVQLDILILWRHRCKVVFGHPSYMGRDQFFQTLIDLRDLQQLKKILPAV